MKVPADKEIYPTEIAEFWFDEEGILCCNSNPVERTIENLNESFELVGKLRGNTRVCLVSDITKTGAQHKKERDFATSQLPKHYKAIAMISGSDFGRTIANVFLTVYNLPIPMKLFADEESAKQWIRKFL